MTLIVCSLYLFMLNHPEGRNTWEGGIHFKKIEVL
jgi:hypothetical protein